MTGSRGIIAAGSIIRDIGKEIQERLNTFNKTMQGDGDHENLV